MCTVTFMPRRKGYCLAMNRDERLSRANGLPPAMRHIAGHRVLYPSEPTGGTWIALNDKGVSLALINWYSVAARTKRNALSRGEIIPCVGAAGSPALVAAGLAALPLGRINPFRLVAVFPAAREIVEWRWDLKRLRRKNHRWRAHQWISSGFDETTAQKVRSQTFRKARTQKSAGTIGWLRRLHRSHAPQIGPSSTCMHRADAATVSYTEVTVLKNQARMLHTSGAPCGNFIGRCSAGSPRRFLCAQPPSIRH